MTTKAQTVPLTHASLFSGIGGGDLAADWAGFKNLFWCEKEPFCQQVLKHHFKESIGYEDITTTDFTVWRGQVTVLTGGFPCQPFSLAGQRKGDADDRYLWDEMLRAVDEIRPAWVVGENVAGLTSMVQSPSNIQVVKRGDLFGAENTRTELIEQHYTLYDIITDLEQLGYAVQPLIIPASGVSAQHTRQRVWIIAHADSKRRQEEWLHLFTGEQFLQGLPPPVRTVLWSSDHRPPSERTLADSRRQTVRRGLQEFPTQSPVCSQSDGVPGGLAGYSFPGWRRRSLIALGNAIVPQVMYELLRGIYEIEVQLNGHSLQE